MYELVIETTIHTKTEEQAKHIQGLYANLHSLLICENSESNSAMKEIMHPSEEKADVSA